MYRGGEYFSAESGEQTIDSGSTNLLGLLNPASSGKRFWCRVVDVSASDKALVTLQFCTNIADGAAITEQELHRQPSVNVNASVSTTLFGTKSTDVTVTGGETFRTAKIPADGPTIIPIHEEIRLEEGFGVVVNITPNADSDTAQAYIEWRED